MQILRTPEPFSPAFGEILYAVSLTGDETGEEISIFNSPVTEKIGIKKATQAPEFSLNVSDYLRGQIHIEPFPEQECGIVPADGRIFYSCIAYQSWAASTPHTTGILDPGRNRPLTENTYRSLDDTEQDEICWIAEPGPVFARALFPVNGSEPVEIHLGRAEVDQTRMLALILNGSHLANLLLQRGYRWDDCYGFSVEIHASFELMARFEYRIRPRNRLKTRLAWWNRYGGIDFHTFESTRSDGYAVEKNSAGIGDRTLNLTARTCRSKTIATACTTPEQTEQLSRIAGSPQVWALENGTALPVEIPDRTALSYDPERTENEIRIVYSQPVLFQTF